MPATPHPIEDVDYISGRTRLFGIVGHPIEQVRSPEMFTAHFRARGIEAILVPLHVLPDDFDVCVPQLLRLRNLDGLVFTIPFKQRAVALAEELGAQARIVGAVNALAKRADGRVQADIFDGIGCVEAFRRRGIAFAGQRVMLVGAGGAGSAIGVAIALERPRAIHVCDVDGARADALARRIASACPGIDVTTGAPAIGDVDVLLNATPVGMLTDARLPIAIDTLPRGLVVFDAIVKPERTPLIELAERCGCKTILGREMMRGQVERMIDFFVGD